MLELIVGGMFTAPNHASCLYLASPTSASSTQLFWDQVSWLLSRLLGTVLRHLPNTLTLRISTSSSGVCKNRWRADFVLKLFPRSRWQNVWCLPRRRCVQHCVSPWRCLSFMLAYSSHSLEAKYCLLTHTWFCIHNDRTTPEKNQLIVPVNRMSILGQSKNEKLAISYWGLRQEDE